MVADFPISFPCTWFFSRWHGIILIVTSKADALLKVFPFFKENDFFLHKGKFHRQMGSMHVSFHF